ncbi:aldehyde ferredoxin oxidoreductase C-terminal domain-containing protein [Desulfosporosinus sp.]|uniref:aldehyde ferredoxin oxidoreductase C-terminal domain-containing protein n=1 Tax=Desulfosporosinus sp. TaxID=157907 RepID=UPI0025C1A2BD|nr:aldehyde ferredoxin oxidoreductase C-terminal domain-containing protein [Desulfosporosinus sp.]MBC2723451.1 aldehyde ferredoxin oxidoreductase [Desulfosporosinus sp.]MBC2727779.1 aldehyde ferredoxin oxidoreductase [Desulfosporosinus sp.]
MWSKLVIDMKTLTVNKEPLDAEYQELGGKSLVAAYLMKNVPPQCDPLSDQNQLLLCTTVFAGTKLTTGHRLSVGAKSPLTGGIKESNAGGYAAALLAEQGIKLVVVKNLPVNDDLWLLHIDEKGNASLKDAKMYEGVNNYEFVEKVRERFVNKLATISIGSAGERLYKSASLQVSEFGSGHPSRAAARGGLGAVMGSKRLKAVVIEKPLEPFKVPYADEEKFNEICQMFNKVVAQNAKNDAFHNIGTISTIDVTGANGVLPVDNFSGKLFPKYTEVGSNKFMSNLAARGGRNKISCQPGCVVQCSNSYNDKDGKYLTSGFEYETIALFGPNCHIDDLDVIAKMDHICDDLGVDTIEIANALAMCMEGGRIQWGDVAAALALLQEMMEGTEFGNLIGNGCEAVGKSLGCKRIPVVKHQSIPGYDPRNTKGTGITYSTSPMGADHTAGLTMGRAFDDCGRAAQAYASNKLQVAMSFADSMMCIFAFANAVTHLPLLGDLMAAQYGGQGGMARIAPMGIKALLTERAFNKLAGMTVKDDRLPDFFYNERSVATGSKFDIIDLELDVLFDF